MCKAAFRRYPMIEKGMNKEIGKNSVIALQEAKSWKNREGHIGKTHLLTGCMNGECAILVPKDWAKPIKHSM